jgi:hypothetical protein
LRREGHLCLSRGNLHDTFFLLDTFLRLRRVVPQESKTCLIVRRKNVSRRIVRHVWDSWVTSSLRGRLTHKLYKSLGGSGRWGSGQGHKKEGGTRWDDHPGTSTPTHECRRSTPRSFRVIYWTYLPFHTHDGTRQVLFIFKR